MMKILKKTLMLRRTVTELSHVQIAIAKMDLVLARQQKQKQCVLLRTDYLE
ncbi:hypothetical protein [Acinetobacter sp. SWAC57]|mgnify:FL=1|uniref:hypothetical protein n=1 Tax=Acinetobacter sp. SWAC57 TaxID=2293834 RepID=UPI0013C3208C|nr:hypothetical protein [Acinetobacter sp. SWAC57]